MNKNTKFQVVFTAITTLVVSLINAPFIQAGYSGEITNPVLSSDLQSLSGLEYFQKLIPALVLIAFIIGSIVFFFMLVVGGIRWITSAGDKAALEGARGMIMNAIVGIILLFSTFAIIKLIETFFGVAILSIDIGPLFI